MESDKFKAMPEGTLESIDKLEEELAQLVVARGDVYDMYSTIPTWVFWGGSFSHQYAKQTIRSVKGWSWDSRLHRPHGSTE